MKCSPVSLMTIILVLALAGCAGDGFDGTMFGTAPCTEPECLGVWDTLPIVAASVGCAPSLPAFPTPIPGFFATVRFGLVGDQFTITGENLGACSTETLTVTLDGDSVSTSEEEEFQEVYPGCTTLRTFTRTFTFSEDSYHGSVSDTFSFSGSKCAPDCSNSRTFQGTPLEVDFACP